MAAPDCSMAPTGLWPMFFGMEILLEDKPAIDRHLARLRGVDKSVSGGQPREWFDRILDLHQITVEPSARDYWRGERIPLRYPLSLLDDDERRSRVSKISFDALAAVEQGLLRPA
jgi:hypothetical protein